MTAKRILVPVGADEHSDAIVPLVAAVARDSGAIVRLLRIYPIPQRREGMHGRTVEYVDQAMSRLTAEARDDLAREEARLAGVPVDTVVRFGETAEEIAREAEAFDADIIALSERRRGRFLRLVRPGVAQRVARATRVPTLTLTNGAS